MELNCKLVDTFMRRYFSEELSLATKDAIVSHIVNCRDCRKKYKDYAKAIGKKFNLIAEIHKVYLECQDGKVEPQHINKLVENETISKRVLSINKKTWTDKAKERRLDDVMNVKSVREFVMDENLHVDGSEDLGVYEEYGWYVIEKKCGIIDSLENIYKQELERDKKEYNAKEG